MINSSQSFDYVDAAESLLELLSQFVHTDLNRALHAMMHGECFALLFLRECAVPMLPSELSTGMNVSTARIATLLNAMEQKGLVVRQPDPVDRRKTRVSLTEKGLAQAEQTLSEIRQNAIFTLSHLSPQDTTDFLRIMRQILQASSELSFPGGKP